MAAGIIEVDTAQLERDKNAVRERINGMRAALAAIYADVAELDAMWDGAANEAFKTQFASDREQFEAICALFEQLTGKLEFARTEYDRCEAEVSAAVSAVRI